MRPISIFTLCSHCTVRAASIKYKTPEQEIRCYCALCFLYESAWANTLSTQEQLVEAIKALTDSGALGEFVDMIETAEGLRLVDVATATKALFALIVSSTELFVTAYMNVGIPREEIMRRMNDDLIAGAEPPPEPLAPAETTEASS